MKNDDKTDVILAQWQTCVEMANSVSQRRDTMNNIFVTLNLAEINAIEHKPMYMSDYVQQLDSVLSSGNRQLLQNSGTVSHKQAVEKAKTEYRKYQEKTIAPVEQAYLDSIKTLEKEAKKQTRK